MEKKQVLNDAEVSDLRVDVRQIYDLLRNVADKISAQSTEVAVHAVQIKHLTVVSEDVDRRLTDIEQLKERFVGGVKLWPAFMCALGGGTVGSTLSWLLSLINGGANHHVGS